MSVPPGDSMLEFDPVVRRRGRGREGAVRVDKAKLQRDPRSRSDIAKRAGSWTMRAIAFGGMNMEDLDDATRSSLGLGKKGRVLRVKHAGQPGPDAAAKKEGFQPEDILVQVDELAPRLTESALIRHLRQQCHPGEKFTACVTRGKRAVDPGTAAVITLAAFTPRCSEMPPEQLLSNSWSSQVTTRGTASCIAWRAGSVLYWA